MPKHLPKVEGKKLKVEGRRQPDLKVEARRQNQNSSDRTLSLSDTIAVGHSPPLRSNPLPPHPVLWQAIQERRL
ncbi:hypothetical protein QUB47_26350 [Microcoleus sp. AT9_B5]